MGLGHAEHLFRRALIARLTHTSFARVTPEHVASTAAQIGVTPEVLEAARGKVSNILRSRAFRLPAGDKRRGTHIVHPQLRLWFPKAIWKEWQDWCELSGMTSSAGLRSAVHCYLLQSWEPKVVSTGWWWREKAYPKPRYPEEHPTEWIAEKTLVTRGARSALGRRAAHGNVTTTAILRGLVYECMDRRLRDLVPIDCRTMWDDPDKYWVPPEWKDVGA